MRNEKNKIDNVRHSLAHLLACAVLQKYPKAKLGIGPTIEHGFYYDILFTNTHESGHKLARITDADFPELEKTMRKLIAQKLPFSGRKVTLAEAKKIFKDQPFKLDLIKAFTSPPAGGKKQPLTVYKTGEVFLDLCRGGHVKNTSEIDPDAFTLTHLAGAYWRGSEKNPQLTRIYGLAFNTKKELDTHLAMLDEAKKRDHRKLGVELELFTFDERVGKGLPLWLPKGTAVKNEIERLAMEKEEQYGYVRVSTPHLAKQSLYETSGHLPYYADGMYPPMKMDDGAYYLKAMNCPHHHVIYASRSRSYRDLPLRLAEYGTVYRNELSGTLAGLLRVRMLSMNDAHIYCRKDQIEEEFKRVLALNLEYFKLFGLKNYSFRLSLGDPKNKEKFVNEPANWKYAEGVLRKILKASGVKFAETRGEAAFYGPKVDVQFTSVIGREETMSTIQLDFAAKKRFNLAYQDKGGKENHEVFVIHRAPLSTHERFMAFLLEHYAGDFPVWLAPVQVKVLPVANAHTAYAEKVFAALIERRIRAELSPANETLGRRIRAAELQKIPYLLVVGEKEQSAQSVNVRKRHEKETKNVSLERFTKTLAETIAARKE
ncbi:MAG: threonine--tRNA ligase [Candidatus Brennerbacteria bacterium]|nr:threonine--tRNA ligase [Candidatus Brennerbacteria bacterium]